MKEVENVPNKTIQEMIAVVEELNKLHVEAKAIYGKMCFR